MIPTLTGLSLIALALSVMISALIRLISTMQLRQRVDARMIGVRELAELSGVTDTRDLQDIFGPPGMDRTWQHVSIATIEQKRRLAGYMMSDPRLHWACMAAGFIAFLSGFWMIQLLLIIAALIQTGAWISAFQLPK